MERNEYFTITAFPDEDREKLMILGTQSGLEGGKIQDAGLTLEYTELGNPTFAEGRLRPSPAWSGAGLSRATLSTGAAPGAVRGLLENTGFEPVTY